MNSKRHIIPFLFEYKWGYKDIEGNVVVEPMWDYADNFYEGFAVVRNDKGLYGYIDSEGQLSIKCQFKEAMKFVNGIALIQTSDGRWEHINCKGENLHNCPWIDVYPYSEGLAAVQIPTNDVDQFCNINLRYGFINEERELVVPCNYCKVASFKNGYARVTHIFGDNEYIVKGKDSELSIEKIIKEDIPEIYHKLSEEWASKWDLEDKDLLGDPFRLIFKDGLAVVKGKNGMYGYINGQGILVIPCKWKSAFSFQDGLAFVISDNQKGGFIDKHGEYVVPPKWKYNAFISDSINWGEMSEVLFSEGLAPVKGKNNKYGFIDKRGKMQIPLRWIEVRNFCEGYAAVKGFNGRYGFTDYRGNLICTLRWAKVADFHDGMARVYDDNLEKYGYLNNRGQLQIPCIFDSGDDFHEGIANVRLHGREITIDEGGDKIEAEYDKPIDNEYSSYEKYSGSYAQDEMGYSDDDIDTIFDGNPDAYWNID